MPLRIAIDARRLRDFGIGTYIRSLLHELGNVDTVNEYVVVTGPSDARTLAGLPSNFKIAQYSRTDADPFDHFAFPLFLRTLGPDLVHLPLNRVPVMMIRPYVVTIHDMSSVLFSEHGGPRAAWTRYRSKRGLLRAELVIAVSEATRRDVQSLMGVPPDRIRLVYNAPNPDFFTERPAPEPGSPPQGRQDTHRILERYQINYPFLLYVGNIRPQKNIPRLIEAFAVVRARLAEHPEYRDLRLLIIGDEISKYPNVRRAVIQSRVENAVRFLGFVPFDTLRSFFEAASVFVFPSLYEGFGLPPLEAMASGTPVVTSNSSSLPEVVGDAAILVNPENVFDIARGVEEVLLRDDLRRELVRKGRKQAARFSWRRTACEVLEIYQEVATRYGR